MKKLIILLLVLISISSFSQEKWRTLTITNLGGVNMKGDYLHTFSLALDYELTNNWSLSSWSGINYNTSYDGGWVSSQIILSKSVLGFNVGVGMLYGSGNLNTPLPDHIYSKDLAGIFQISRRFKLNRKK